MKNLILIILLSVGISCKATDNSPVVPLPDPSVIEDPIPSPTIPPPPPMQPRIKTRPATAYIQWTCHETKVHCVNRQVEATQINLAYTVWRGERDLAALLTVEGQRYLHGGDRASIALTVEQLGDIIEYMAGVKARGDRLSWRVLNEKHRKFDSDQLGDWHRSQVRKSVAREMRNELNEETAKYHFIEQQLPSEDGCDTISCRVSEWSKSKKAKS